MQKERITISLDYIQAEQLRELAKKHNKSGSVSQFISSFLSKKSAGKWQLQFVPGGNGSSDYAVAFCPCCRSYLSPDFGTDRKNKTRVYSAHVLGGTPDMRRHIILDNALKIKYPNYCSFCGQYLNGSEIAM